MSCKCIFVCSAYSGDVEANVHRAKRYCKFVMEKGHAPFAPHLLYPQMLDDVIPEQRVAGMACGMAFLANCNEMWVFSENRVVSLGMQAEIDEAIVCGVSIHWLLDFPKE